MCFSFLCIFFLFFFLHFSSKVLSYLPALKSAIDKSGHSCPVVSVDRGENSKARESPAGLKPLDWNKHLEQAPQDVFEPVHVKSSDPLYYLHTSGTTGKPKALVRPNGGHAVQLLHSMEEIYGIRQGDVMCAFSDIGWVVGHSYIVYAPLLRGAASVMIEGKPVGTPDHLQWFRTLEKHRVNTVFCAPTGVRAIKKVAQESDFLDFNLSYLRAWFLAGERADIATIHWLKRVLGHQTPVMDHFWQTESGGPLISSGFMGAFGGAVPSHDGSTGFAVPGVSFSADVDTKELYIKLPLPPAFATTLLGDDGSAFREKYLSQREGHYWVGDAGEIRTDGHISVIARVDDVINVAGHRLSTGQIEEAVMRHANVSEAAVVGRVDELKGHVPVAFVVLRDRNTIDEETMTREIVAQVRESVGAVAHLSAIWFIPSLPKTRSGKLLRNLLRQLADNEKGIHVSPTIEDESVVDQIRSVLGITKLG